MKNLTHPTIAGLLNSGLDNVLMVSIDRIAGDYYIVNGEAGDNIDNQTFYNGRQFGLNSNIWVAKTPPNGSYYGDKTPKITFINSFYTNKFGYQHSIKN